MKKPVSFCLWQEETEDRFIFGFTDEFLKSAGTVWNIIPKWKTDRVSEGQVMMCFESSRTLLPIKSPVTGIIGGWNEAGLTRPHSFTSDDYLFFITKEKKNDEMFGV